MIYGLRLCDLFSRSNATVLSRGKEPSLFCRVLMVVMALGTLWILIMRGGQMAAWQGQRGIDQVLAIIAYTSHDLALFLFPTTLVIYVNRIRTNTQTTKIVRPLFPHLLAWVTIVAAMTRIGLTLIGTISNAPKWATFWQTFAMCYFDSESYDYIMAALLARELALMPPVQQAEQQNPPVTAARQRETATV
jgi:hypothetical protein